MKPTRAEILEYARNGITHMDDIEFEVFETRAENALRDYINALARYSIGRDRVTTYEKTDGGLKRLIAMLGDPVQCAAQRTACYGSDAPPAQCDAQYACCMNGC
jgi:hypothetical protein